MKDYMGGDCQRLTAAIQQVTRWDVAVLDGAGMHVVTGLPNGNYLDAEGTHNANELCETWKADEIEHVGSIDNLGWLGCFAGVEDYEAARRVLATAGLLTESVDDNIDYQIETLRLQSGDDLD